MSRIKTHVNKGDTVEVITGADKGITGKVLDVNANKGRVSVEGVRMTKKHTKPSQQNEEGGIIEAEGWIDISNVKLLEKAEA
jgi:large subunit ribosomal protein L24